MNKHIHIHLPKGVSLGRKTKDAGFDESKHKRDHGRFATTSGPNGGDHEHHFKQGEHHAAEAKKLSKSAVVSQRQAGEAHEAASDAHHNASEHLKIGNVKQAQEFADEANRHAMKAANLRGGAGTAPIPSEKPAEENHFKTWEDNVKKYHPGAEFKKNAKDGKLHAWVGTDNVGSYHFQAGLRNAMGWHKGPDGKSVYSTAKENSMVAKPAPKAAAPAAADITKHSQYTKADYDYLKGKGWSDKEISQRWDEEHKAGKPPQQVNKYKTSLGRTSQDLDRIQSEHAKRTGQALSRFQAAKLRVGIK